MSTLSTGVLGRYIYVHGLKLKAPRRKLVDRIANYITTLIEQFSRSKILYAEEDVVLSIYIDPEYGGRVFIVFDNMSVTSLTLFSRKITRITQEEVIEAIEQIYNSCRKQRGERKIKVAKILQQLRENKIRIDQVQVQEQLTQLHTLLTQLIHTVKSLQQEDKIIKAIHILNDALTQLKATT
ncbi:MAG: hypothetical protein DRJ40_10870 [Thermoprotei archaeon]|nr:MAG: hypothetical protein DRJ40_10870 [Thermoprotei archaeon]